MAFWYRIGQSKPKIFSTLFRRCYIHLPHTPSFNSIPLHRKPRDMEMPYWIFHNRPTDVCNYVRFFAAPVQAQPKKEERVISGPLLNDQIKAPFVRLVIGDEHSILSRFEALERARKLKLDLVEVQRDANPPVCKIMDYHKEMYKQKEKEKERAKSKSNLTLRKGDCKEVRFSAKTELKDLKMKADMIKKLMEKGYRVKCKALGTEDQDLKGLLSKLSALIEDVSVVESGPNLANKEASMIVRHVKFGPPKKGRKKLQDTAHMAVKAQEADMAPSESGVETEEEVLSDGDEHMSFSMSGSVRNIKDYSRYKRTDPEPPAVTENRYKRTDSLSKTKVPSSAQAPPAVTENRYKRVEPRNRFQQTSVDEIECAVTSGSGNMMPPLEDNPKRGLLHRNAPNAPRPGYGIFSASKGPETQGNS